MAWWKQPHDLTSFTVQQQESGDIILTATHYPQPSEPEDFSSGPEIIITGAIHMPGGGVITYLGDGVFNIGRIKHVCDPDMIYEDPLRLTQKTPHIHGWLE